MSLEKAEKYLEEKGFLDHVIELEASTATVTEAAEALHVEPGMIAKTMSFLQNDKAVLILTEGTARVDNRKYKDTFHIKAKMIPFDEVENIINRGRKMELKDDLVDYYYSINQGFKDWYKGYSQSPVLKIDCTDLDFVNDVNDQNYVLDTIEQKLVDLGLKSQDWLAKTKAKRVFYTVDFSKENL